MVIKKFAFFAIVIFAFFINLALAVVPVSNCGEPINIPGETYVMQNSITDNDLTNNCFTISAPNIIFDCADFSISSNDAVAGIYSNQDNTDIRNCNINMGSSGQSNLNGVGIKLINSDFSNVDTATLTSQDTGIYVKNSNSVVLDTITSTNSDWGVYVSESSQVTIRDSFLQNNFDYDLKFDTSNPGHCANILTNVIGSGGLPIGYYATTVSESNNDYSELILCDADGSDFTNTDIINPTSVNTLYIIETDGLTLNGITSSNNFNGIEIRDSSGITIDNSEFNNNQNGNQMRRSTDNIFTNVQMMENQGAYDFYMGNPEAWECVGHDFIGVTGSGGRPIEFYNSGSVGISDATFSELILCDADGIDLIDVTIDGSDSLDNNALFVIRTDDATFRRVTSSQNNYGIYFYESHGFGEIEDITTNSNQESGIFLLNSNDNIFGSSTQPVNSHFNKEGIKLVNSDQNTIKDSTFGNNLKGIEFELSDRNIVTNVLSTHNFFGVHLKNSKENDFDNSDFVENEEWDFYIKAFSEEFCQNTLTNIVGSGGLPIEYFYTPAFLHSSEFSELILCNADNSIVSHVNITGSDTLFNNGLLLVQTDDSNIAFIESSYNLGGILFQDESTSNLVVQSNASYSIYGFYVGASVAENNIDNELHFDVACFNEQDFLCVPDIPPEDFTNNNCFSNSGCGNGCIFNCLGGAPDCYVDADCEDFLACTDDFCVDGTCVNDPLPVPCEGYCGDGTVQPPEECDDGNNEDDDGCTSECLDEFCGDGVVNQLPGTEECDDGNNDNGDGCDEFCILEGPVDFCELYEPWVYPGAQCGAGCDIEWCGDYNKLDADHQGYPGDIREEACNTDCALAALRERAFYGLSEGSCEWDVDDSFCYFSHFDCKIISEFGDCNVDTNQRTITFWSEDQDGSIDTDECSNPCEEGEENIDGKCVRDVPCAKVIQLPFFDWRGIVLSFLLVGVLYYFMFVRKP
jgi:cysteine-rich repeat protein